MNEENQKPNQPDTKEETSDDSSRSPGVDRGMSSEETSDDSSRSPGVDRGSPGVDRGMSSSENPPENNNTEEPK